MTYGRLVDGVIEYFVAYRGGIHVGNKVVFTKSEKVYNKYGWYRVENVADDGTDYQEGNVIYHFTGKPVVNEETEVTDEEVPTTDGGSE